jgi:hypothetical protein
LPFVADDPLGGVAAMLPAAEAMVVVAPADGMSPDAVAGSGSAVAAGAFRML